MARVFNLARMNTATTGTGAITLGSAVAGFLSFSAAGVTDGMTLSYGIKDGSSSEVGRGTYSSSGTQLTRSVLRSTNSNNPINLSGSAEVFITAVAEDFGEWGKNHDANGFNLGFDNATGIVDDSSNEQLIFGKTASAVNNFRMTNAATGNAPALSAEGDDTNIDVLLTPKGTGVVKGQGGVPLIAGGKHTICLPAGAWQAKASAGAVWSTYQDVPVWSFNGTSVTRIRTMIAMPKSWNEGTITFDAFGVVDTGGSASHVAVFKMAAVAYGHDDAAWTTSDLSTGAQSSQMAWTANDDCLKSAESSALTIAGTPAEQDRVLLEFWRDPVDGSDNSSADFLIDTVNVYITINAPTDA